MFWKKVLEWIEGSSPVTLLFLYQGEVMDNISLALNNFKELMNCNYDFIIVCNKQKSDIKLTFESKDFYHLVGFQYLKDIDIPKKWKTVI